MQTTATSILKIKNEVNKMEKEKVEQGDSKITPSIEITKKQIIHQSMGPLIKDIVNLTDH